ncbi:MAG: hypothetical protein MUF78_04875 [Candidatus Edwardsbacteria bacterium]|jgi:hypothetical protein|nr:hypothetical protein [Candidatus Edwardsbacteria bacterium]
MNYTAIVNQAWEVAWKRRYLWVFGFFAGMGGNTIGNIGGRGGREQAEHIAGWITAHPGLVGALILGGALLWMVLIALQSLSYAALVHATGTLAGGGTNDFDSSLDAGFRWFWRVFGLQLLLGLLVLALLAAAGMPLLLAALTQRTGAIIAAAVWLAVAILPVIAIAAVATIVWDLALRYAVLDDRTAGQAIGDGWRLFRANLGPSVVIWLIMAALGMAFGFALIVPLVVFGIPFIIAGAFNPWLGIVPAVVLGLPLMAVLVSVYGVFETAYWSEAFVALTRPAGGPGAATA